VFLSCDRSCFFPFLVCFLLRPPFSGGTLERGFRRVLNDVPMGSLLVPSNNTDGEPLMLHVMLPVCVRKRHMAEETWVFLLDAQVSEGRSKTVA
jgi:uridine kinase